MNQVEAIIPPPPPTTAKLRASRRSLVKALMMWVRRGHLYLGLFLFPWAILYGVTAFLFNHPTAFSDQPMKNFGKDALVGTSLETLPSPQTIAEQVVAKLNAAQQPETPYLLAGPAKFGGREFAFASVKAQEQTVSLLLDLNNGGGIIRVVATRERKEVEKAPFATGGSNSSGGRPGRGPAVAPGKGGAGRGESSSAGGAVRLDFSLAEQIKSAVPTILERSGFPTGEVTVTSLPDVVFPVEASGKTWTATYNPLTGAVSGTLASTGRESELTWRRFLLRLHLAHGYPGEINGRWFWALAVDAMAFTMCFWGLSGLVMWWQIKATRLPGAVVLVLSAAAATALGLAMHTAMTQ
jgi:hypothetical protein